MLYIHALSPIHSGSGQSSGIIDLPVSREKTTGWPDLPGSAIKGVLRDRCEPDGSVPDDVELFNAAFGAAGLDETPPEAAQQEAQPTQEGAAEPGQGAGGAGRKPSATGAGMLWFTHAHLLCLPVRSFYGSFAWVTCPLALHRWQRDHQAAGLPCITDNPPIPGNVSSVLLPTITQADSILIDTNNTVFLEDLDLAATNEQLAGKFGSAIAKEVLDADWHDDFLQRFAIVSNDVFTFLTETGTDVNARIRIDDTTRTVADGQLWYEEALPADSILAAPLIASPRRGLAAGDLLDVVGNSLDGVIQIGGRASVGRGLVRMKLSGGIQ